MMLLITVYGVSITNERMLPRHSKASPSVFSFASTSIHDGSSFRRTPLPCRYVLHDSLSPCLLANLELKALACLP
jgi:hypothetical protein